MAKILLLVIMMFLTSCAHLKSGEFVKLQKGDSASLLAKYYGVSEEDILSANPDKEFREGDLIFIPLKRGLLSHWSGGWGSDAGGFWGGKGNFLWPVPTSKVISSKYGPRGKSYHKGIDVPATEGSSIVAVDDGIIYFSGEKVNGYGNLTIISHKNNLYTIYAHAKENFTKKGQRVSRGQVIAEVGNTGRSTGPHLHFEVRNGNKTLDPLLFLNL